MSYLKVNLPTQMCENSQVCLFIPRQDTAHTAPAHREEGEEHAHCLAHCKTPITHHQALHQLGQGELGVGGQARKYEQTNLKSINDYCSVCYLFKDLT